MATKRASLREAIDKEFGTRDLPLKNAQKTNIEPTDDHLVIFSVRLPQSQKKALQRYFKNDMGLNMSSGVRMVLTSYMRDKSISI